MVNRFCNLPGTNTLRRTVTRLTSALPDGSFTNARPYLEQAVDYSKRACLNANWRRQGPHTTKRQHLRCSGFDWGRLMNARPGMFCKLTALTLSLAAQLCSTQSAANNALPETEAVSGYRALANYALAIAAKEGGGARPSALIEPSTINVWPSRRPCAANRLAIVVDLDPDLRVFDPNDPPLPADDIVTQLGRVRNAGVVIVWATALSQTHESAVRTVLAATEVSPANADILVMASQRFSKYERIHQLAPQLCIIAMGGDRIGDFEQAYDYLKDPEGPIANVLAAHVGIDWFLVPTPIS